MSTSIVGANHRATKIEIVLPVDEDGEYAFDDRGKPVKGVEPVTVLVPRYDCLTRTEFRELMSNLEGISEGKEDGEPLPAADRVYEEVLAVITPYVTEAQAALVENLRLFEVKQIAQRLQDGNSMSVGELLASTGSSKSTARPSSTTSSE